MADVVFKIRDSKTGLFSTGGQEPRWDANGKKWRNIGHLKNHIRQYMTRGCWDIKRRVPASWEVVAYDVTCVEKTSITARSFEPRAGKGE